MQQGVAQAQGSTQNQGYNANSQSQSLWDNRAQQDNKDNKDRRFVILDEKYVRRMENMTGILHNFWNSFPTSGHHQPGGPSSGKGFENDVKRRTSREL